MVPYDRGMVLSDSMNVNSDRPIGTSMAVVAVLLIPADKTAAIPPP